MGHYQLPPGKKWQDYELSALGLRAFAGARPGSLFNPFELARYANLIVIDFEQIEGLSKETRNHLLGDAASEWSGGVCSRLLPDGARIVILNPKHGRTRTVATLMEEICHVFLGHVPNRLSIIAPDERGKALARDYRKLDEEAAYAVGAATLVPYGALRKLVLEGRSAAAIGRVFRVSKELVEYRIKVTRLRQAYKAGQSSTSTD